MYSLALDSSSNRCIIAINKERVPIAYRYLSFDRDISKIIFPSIKELFLKSPVSIDMLSFIAAGEGPGSYTGIRISAAIAKSISFAKDIPFVSFSSLKILAPEEKGPFISIIETNKESCYILKGEKDETVSYQETPSLVRLSDIRLDSSKSLFISPSKRVIDTLKNWKKRALLVDPDPHQLADISFSKFKKRKIFNKLFYPPEINCLQHK